MAIADTLRRLREENHLSQEALAEQLGVSRQAVSKWESGASYPETEKILMLCSRFGLSADELLFDRETPAADHGGGRQTPAHRARRWIAAAVLLLLAVGLCVFGALWQSAKTEASALGQELTERDAQLAAQEEDSRALAAQRDEQAQQLDAQTQQLFDLQAALAELENTPADITSEAQAYALLSAYFFDFAQRWRLDYIPYFSRGEAPTESADYLMWAFAVNLPNWGEEEKGTMSKSYVGNAIRSHFGLTGIAHTPLPKTWDLEGEDYKAVAGGVNEAPIFGLSAFSVSFENGTAVYDVELTRWGMADGSIPMPAKYADIRKALGEGIPAALTPIETQRFVFSCGIDGPVFLAHTLL